MRNQYQSLSIELEAISKEYEKVKKVVEVKDQQIY